MYYTIFFAIWLLSGHAVFADTDPSGQAQAQAAQRWKEYVEGCNKPIVPPVSPIEQSALSAECIAIFSHVVFGTPFPVQVPAVVGN